MTLRWWVILGKNGGRLGHAQYVKTYGCYDGNARLPGNSAEALILSATIHPDIKRPLLSISKLTGMTVSQVADEVLYTGLIEMQELDPP